MTRSEFNDVIKPISLTTGRSSAAEQLRLLIESNHFAIGDRLPSERELAARLGVSRTTLREALSTLEAQGLVEVRHGSGTYVTAQVSQTNLSSMWSTWYAAHRHELIHLLQVRSALESKAGVLAAANATPEFVRGLQEIVATMRAAAERGNFEEVVQLDVRFHGAIAAASGNPILIQLLSSLDSVLENERQAVFSLKRRPGGSLREHSAIVAAIEQQDLHAVQLALQTHFERVIEDVQVGPEG